MNPLWGLDWRKGGLLFELEVWGNVDTLPFFKKIVRYKMALGSCREHYRHDGNPGPDRIAECGMRQAGSLK
jgi:hypothetical protein